MQSNDRTLRRPIPRPRKVTIRLDPGEFYRLERLSRTTGVELEVMARQLLVAGLDHQRWAR